MSATKTRHWQCKFTSWSSTYSFFHTPSSPSVCKHVACIRPLPRGLIKYDEVVSAIRYVIVGLFGYTIILGIRFNLLVAFFFLCQVRTITDTGSFVWNLNLLFLPVALHYSDVLWVWLWRGSRKDSINKWNCPSGVLHYINMWYLKDDEALLLVNYYSF